MLPLKGLKVVDLTTFLATPTTGRVLGEWGADVIKVEAFKGDPCRTNQAVVFGMPSSDEENLAFDMANFHKRFVALNLKSEKGLEVMMKLLSEADVFITNTRTKSLAKMGLDWESLHEKFPRLIMGHGIGYGKKGAEKDAAGCQRIALVSHGAAIKTLICAIMDMPLDRFSRFDISNCSISVIESINGTHSLLTLNDLSHFGDPYAYLTLFIL